MGGKPLWHGCCIMLSESRSQKGRGDERELGTEDLSGGPFKKQIIDKKQVEIPREAQAEQRMRKIEIRRFLLCC